MKEFNLADKVRELLYKGLGRNRIAQELAITEGKARTIIQKIRELEDIPRPVNQTTLCEIEAAERINNILDLKAQGLSHKEIGERLNLNKNSIQYWLARSKTFNDKKSQADIVREILDVQDADVYDIAKKFEKTPSTAKTLYKKAEVKYDPMREWVIRNCRFGISMNKLKTELAVKSVEKAEKILTETFQDSFIIKEQRSDDVFLIPIQDSSKEYEWLDIDTSKKKFKYFVSKDENYMSIKFDEDIKADTIKIYNFSDVHIGSRANRLELLKEMINMVKEDPGAFVVFGGDMIEAITKASVADPMDQYLSLNEQMVACVRLFMPIAHKILAYEWGNHDSNRTYKTCEFDLSKAMANMLKVPYFRPRVVIDLYFRNTHKTISLTHKYGKALTETAIIKEVEKITASSTFPIHCFFSGHNHTAFVRHNDVQTRTPGKGFETLRYYIANAGSFVSRTGTYAEYENLPPTPQDLVYFYLDDKDNHGAGFIPIQCI